MTAPSDISPLFIFSVKEAPPDKKIKHTTRSEM